MKSHSAEAGFDLFDNGDENSSRLYPIEFIIEA